MNSVNLTGRITRDLELRKITNGVSCLEFSIAINRRKKDEADFINIVAWQHSADFLSRYASKGTMIEVSGRLSTSNYTKENGEKVYKTFVVAESVAIISKPKEAHTILYSEDSKYG